MKNPLSSLNIVAMLSIAVFSLTFLPAGATWGAEFDIPLNEIKKAEKKPASKRETSKPRPKKPEPKKAEVKKPETKNPEAKKSEPVAASAQTDPPPVLQPEAANDDVRVIHEPYSYLLPGRRTTITAVISSSDELPSVRCRFQASDAKNSGLVAMTKVAGTQYTYTAVIPALAGDRKRLQYLFISRSKDGKMSRSREFFIPVNPGGIGPGWQSAPASEAIAITLEHKNKPLDGFADKTVEEKAAPQP